MMGEELRCSLLLEHLRAACCCQLVQKHENPGKKHSGTSWNELVALKS